MPTSGVQILRHALVSVTDQLEAGDEIIAIRNDDRDFGNNARNSGVDRANGTHIVFFDDDEYLRTLRIAPRTDIPVAGERETRAIEVLLARRVI